MNKDDQKNIHLTSQSYHYKAMGANIDLQVYGTKDSSILEKTVQLISYYERLLTVNKDKSEVMNINKSASKHAVQVSIGTYSLIKLAVEQSKKQFGFNALIGPIVKLWHIGFSDAHVPTQKQIIDKLKLINPSNVKLNDNDQSVFLTRRGMELDLGGIAKGWIADRIYDLWRAYGIKSGLINLGGNILFVGKSPNFQNGNWIVEIQDPLKKLGNSIASVMVPSCSVVTSGVYERYLLYKNKRYHHIMDPKTGSPVKTHLLSVTTFTKHSVQGEIECKRLFFAGKPIKNWVDEIERFGAIFIYDDGSIIYDGLNK